MITERVKCPLCGSEKCLPERVAADICKCDRCSAVYLRTRPTVAELEKFYQNYASNPGSHMKLPTEIDHLRTSPLRRDAFLNEVTAHTGAERRRLLDIGSGWGAFLFNAREKGFEVRGIEICKQMADFANMVLGIQTYITQLEGIVFAPEHLQVVTMLHSFEHLPNQRFALNFIHRVLEPSGLLFGIMPNFASFCSKAMRDAWPWLDPNFHYAHLTPDVLAKLLWSCGFNTLKMWTATGDFDRAILQRQLKIKLPRMQDSEVTRTIEQLEKNNEGEELRWVARKI
jgi:2-polyprenyl-3-methyl-5-hydroxy-6-metoxy-1,4-benzoquinol methylase